MSAFHKMVGWYLALALIFGIGSFEAARSHHPILAMFIVLVPVSLIINGCVAEWEDRRQGGVNNPHPEAESTTHRDA